MPEPQACKRCHRMMQWAISPQGSRIPLDATPVRTDLDAQSFAVLYEIIPNRQPGEINTRSYHRRATDNEYSRAMQAGARLFSSHFATCPHAGEFSKTNKGKGRQGAPRQP